MLMYNRNASLTLNESGISARYGFLQRLDCAYNNIALVVVEDDTLVLFLSVNYMCRVSIFGYHNSDDVYYTMEIPDGNVPQPVIVKTSKVFSSISEIDIDIGSYDLIELPITFAQAV